MQIMQVMQVRRSCRSRRSCKACKSVCIRVMPARWGCPVGGVRPSTHIGRSASPRGPLRSGRGPAVAGGPQGGGGRRGGAGDDAVPAVPAGHRAAPGGRHGAAVRAVGVRGPAGAGVRGDTFDAEWRIPERSFGSFRSGGCCSAEVFQMILMPICFFIQTDN